LPSPGPFTDPDETLSEVAVIVDADVYVYVDLDLDADVVAVVCLDESTA